MTEAEWLVCTNPISLLRLLGPRATGRKVRLLASACFRERGWDGDRIHRDAVEVAERYADGLADGIDLLASQPRVRSTTGNEPRVGGRPHPDEEEVIRLNWKNFAARDLTDERMNAVEPVAIHAAGKVGGRVARRYHVALLRDMFGNPFRPVTVEPACLTSTVVSLAEGIYAERAFDRLPIFADALKDAGCDNADILDHCRGPGPHVRGCWVVDLVLGKS
jgi:hypothetical protein